jgi:hypothetical protein
MALWEQDAVKRLLESIEQPLLYKGPILGEHLFSGGQQDNSWLGVDLDWDSYVAGYKEAADRLVEDIVLDKHILPLRHLANPILFLYRQHVELRLKEMLLSAGLIRDLNDLCKGKEHNLIYLWQMIRAYLDEEDEASGEGGHEERTRWLDAAEEKIKELNDDDHNSMAFRYPTDKGLKAFHRSVTYFDVVQLREQMDRLSNFLDVTSCGIYEVSQQRAEVE